MRSALTLTSGLRLTAWAAGESSLTGVAAAPCVDPNGMIVVSVRCATAPRLNDYRPLEGCVEWVDIAIQ